MGRMKEHFMQLRMEQGAIHAQELPYEEIDDFITSNILCPNCTMEFLTPVTDDELDCKACGQEFNLIENNTVKYK